MNQNLLGTSNKSRFFDKKTQSKSFKTYSNLEDNFDEHLIQQQLCQSSIQSIDFNYYDPFQSPPNFIKAQRHHKATSIGIPNLNNDNSTQISKNMQICQCCQNFINKKPISLMCNPDQLLFLGIGYPLYYKLTKYIALIIILIFFICGSGFYFISSIINCKENCLNFLGLNIINFEQSNQPNYTIQIVNMITAIGIFGFVIYIKSNLAEDIVELQKKVICPSHYTIMVQNLPKDFQQFQFNNWITKTFQAQCEAINLGYNISQIEKAYRKRNQCTIQLRKIQIDKKNKQQKKYDNAQFIENKYDQKQKQKELKNQIEKYDKIIMDYKNFDLSYEKNGTAFITFEKIQTVQRILDKFQQGFFRKIFPNVSILKKSQLQFRGNNLIVSRAPAPRQVIWENLTYSYFKNFTFQFLFICSMCFLIYFAFKYQFQFSNYAYKLRTEGKQTGHFLIIFQAIVMSLIVVLLNCLLRVIIFIFTKLKKYHSYTAQQSSFCFYYTLTYVLNSCFMIYIVHSQYHQQSNELLLYDIHFVMLANAFSQPLFKLFDPIMWHRILWKSYLKSLKGQNNPYTQIYVNKWWQGHQISNGDNYQYIARILFISVWFAHPAPLGIVFSLIGMFFDYWIGKILLLRVYKKPQNISKNIANTIINCFQLLPLIYICGVLQFTFKVSTTKNVFEFLTNFFHYGIAVSILIMCILGYLMIFKSQKKQISQITYSQIKAYFGFNYETQNPITKFKGQINYLKGIQNNNKTISYDDQQLLKQILIIGQNLNNLKQLQKIKLGIGRIKPKVLRKNTFNSGDSDDAAAVQLNQMSPKLIKLNSKPLSRGSSSSQQPEQKYNSIQHKKKLKIRRIPTLIAVD